MNEHDAMHTAVSVSNNAVNELTALTQAIDEATYWTWPRTWTHRGTEVSAARLAAAVAVAVRATAVLADTLDVALSPARPAPAEDLRTAVLQMFDELERVANVVRCWTVPVENPVPVIGSQLDALVAAMLAVAAQRGVTTKVRAVLDAPADGPNDPTISGNVKGIEDGGRA